MGVTVTSWLAWDTAWACRSMTLATNLTTCVHLWTYTSISNASYLNVTSLPNSTRYSRTSPLYWYVTHTVHISIDNTLFLGLRGDIISQVIFGGMGSDLTKSGVQSGFMHTLLMMSK